jgi:Protein tyrosine and serine/threonine kinase
MAPEVARGDEYNLKADCYSFSILLYEVMDLSKAFSGWDPREIMEKVHQKKYRPKTSLFWPKSIRDLLKSTWSDTPNARLSMKNVQILLDKCLDEIARPS